MTPGSAKSIEEEIALYFERAGLPAELKNEAYLKRALAEIAEAGEMVRKGIARNDEPAAAFRVPPDHESSECQP